MPFLFDGSEFVRLLTSGVGLLFLLLVLPGGLSEAFYRVQRLSTDWHANSFSGAVVRKITRGMGVTQPASWRTCSSHWSSDRAVFVGNPVDGPATDVDDAVEIEHREVIALHQWHLGRLQHIHPPVGRWCAAPTML